MTPFDPGAAASPQSGIFGLPHDEAAAAVTLIPVPFAATVSYGGGAERGPDAILAASRQVDLYDLHFGRAYERGLFLRPADPRLGPLHEEGRRLCLPLLERGGAGPEDAALVARIDAIGAQVNAVVQRQVESILAQGKIPGLIGGDHSTPYGAIAAVAARHPGLGILHVDAHADLRAAYEGLRWSHASILHNVMADLPGVARLVQVGIRDFCEEEAHRSLESQGRILTHYDQEWRRRQFGGETFAALCERAIAALPQQVYVTVDIDGLDPSLCPNTGTPVPGGLSFAEFAHLIATLAESGRRILGFDLVEVAPGEQDEWDANVGARVLYKLALAALHSHEAS